MESIVAALGKQVGTPGWQRDPSKVLAAPCLVNPTYGIPVYPLEPPRSVHTGRDPRALAIFMTVCLGLKNTAPRNSELQRKNSC